MPTVKLLSGLNMLYREHGDGEKAVVLIHGNWASSRWFEKVLATLPPDVRAIAPDLRGSGDTDKPDGPWSMYDLAEDVYQLTEVLGVSRFTVVGHSLGGSVALQLAVDHPKAVERLVLINAAPANGLGLDAAKIAQVAWLTQHLDVARQALGSMMPTAPQDELYQAILEDAVTKSVGAVVRNTEALESMNLVGAAAQLQTPALIIHGALDPLVNREVAERCHMQIAGSVLEEWEGIGHSAPVEAPERLVKRLIEFMG
jgi:3-oxoadipate enol-lactonase